MNSQELMFMQLYGGGLLSAGSTWLKVVFLAFLLGVPVYRPERIRNVSLYRRAYMCFGLSIIIPSASTFLLAAVMSPGGTGMGRSIGNSSSLAGNGLLQLLGAAGPVLFGISLICALGAVVPGFIPPPGSRNSGRLQDTSSSTEDDESPGGRGSTESMSP
ncbi:MAG: hypothetical protein ABGZ35_23315 [Planctomycetaceae bacterium]|jgi:hypothetical protein